MSSKIYLKGDQYIDSDSSASSPETVNRILDLKKDVNNEHELTFDVVMSKDIHLNDEAYEKSQAVQD